MHDNNTPTTASLIEQGYLVPPRLYVRPAVLEHELHAPAVVEAYKSTCTGKRVIVYVNTVVHAEFLAAQFNAAGIYALTILARDNDALRKAALTAFTSGVCMVLITINIDLSPAKADGVIIATPHHQPRKYEHQILSAMRPRYADNMWHGTDAQRRDAITRSDKPVAMVLDLADNWQRHPDVIASVNHRAKPDTHLTIPGSLEWDQVPEVVAVVGQTAHASPETDVIHMPGIDSLPVGTELVDRIHVTRLREELARERAISDGIQMAANNLQQRLTAAEQRIAELEPDAARYRHIVGHEKMRIKLPGSCTVVASEEETGAAIDAMIAALKPTESGASE